MPIMGLLTFFMTSTGLCENIDPYDSNAQYAYGENIGWVNFEPNLVNINVGAQVSNKKIEGFIWAENIGWINLSPQHYGGVFNDGCGNLSGYAWGENVGWINFSPTVLGDTLNQYRVIIDSEGNFSGWAWGENIGWINFGLSENYVVACKVTLEDLANFVEEWLNSGPDWEADLYYDEKVDFRDYSIFANYWLDYCPDGWMLK